MIWIQSLALLLFFAVTTGPEIPVGTAIPIMLGSELNAKKGKIGQQIEGKVMQDVPLPGDEKIKKGSRVAGRIVSLTRTGSSGSSMVVRFDTVEDHDRTIPIQTAVLAIASMGSVAQAQVPINVGSSDIDPVTQWTTRQVGGDIVSRGRGKAGSPGGEFGRWIEGSSVMIKLTPNPSEGCPSGPGYDREQAVWIFSSAACGTYDLGQTKIAGSGESAPLGDVSLKSDRNISIRKGSGWLLITVAAK
jgi:hypothetical protein